MVLEKNEVIAKWVYEYTNEMYRYAWSKILDREAAEDLVQNTFLAGIFVIQLSFIIILFVTIISLSCIIKST
jgi:hypothetical protein